MKTEEVYIELGAFIDLMNEQYGDAVAVDDVEGMMQLSGALSITYALIGNHSLAKRWAHEYLDRAVLE
ncbi:MAG: hypothetical protein EOL87_00775 [Spartobacteria bacterium]|nr:hypothetical protein [Spartobacteria bacterium]